MAGAGDNGVEWVVKHTRFSLPAGLKATRRNRAPTANSSRANGPTYHSLAFAPELIRRAWFVAPSSGSKKSTRSVVPPAPPDCDEIQGEEGRLEPPRNWIDGLPDPTSKNGPFMISWPICAYRARRFGRSRALRFPMTFME